VDRVVLLSDGAVLNRYWDESDKPRPEAYRQEIQLAKDSLEKNVLFRNLRSAAESGWDFSSRWFQNKKEFSSIHTSEIIPVDLNCLLYNLEKTIAGAYQVSNKKESAEKFETLAGKRKQEINKFCWNEEVGFYFDYDYVKKQQTDSYTLAAAFPLYFGMASQQQADGVAKILKEQFLFSGGLVSTTETTNQQWDAPNGWAPLHWIAVKGLARYGHTDLAADIAKRWMEL